MPTNNLNGRSRRLRNGWPVSDLNVPGWVYTLHFLEPLGSPQDRRGHAQHYTGWSGLDGLAARLGAHWDGTCGVRLVVAFRRAGIPFLVASIEPGTRSRNRGCGDPWLTSSTGSRASWRARWPGPQSLIGDPGDHPARVPRAGHARPRPLDPGHRVVVHLRRGARHVAPLAERARR